MTSYIVRVRLDHQSRHYLIEVTASGVRDAQIAALKEAFRRYGERKLTAIAVWEEVPLPKEES